MQKSDYIVREGRAGSPLRGLNTLPHVPAPPEGGSPALAPVQRRVVTFLIYSDSILT